MSTFPKYREFLSLTDDEIRQIVTDLFSPKKITCIKHLKRFNEITCKIYTEWEGDPGEDPYLLCDELTLREPFSWTPISVDFSLNAEDVAKYKKFCLAKGICPWLKDNPYLEETK